MLRVLVEHKGKGSWWFLRFRVWGWRVKGVLRPKQVHRKMAEVELRQQGQENPMGIKHFQLEEGPQQRFLIRASQTQQVWTCWQR